MRELAHFYIIYRGHEMRRLQNEARRRGITVQALLRAVVIPEWLKKYEQTTAR